MGWKEGQGLGKESQGIVVPIATEVHAQYAGLGSVGSGDLGINPGDTYHIEGSS